MTAAGATAIRPTRRKDAPFVVRLKAEQTGETIVHDVVQGDVQFANEQLDDMILLRSDGTPTYMLAVVVDDHDMGVTHVIRGDDHLNNTPRQMQIIKAMGWPVPVYGHVPMIHGPDGAKLSKRHGALAVEAYRDMGYLPETMRNYLLRLGWSHGDDEIISTEQAIEWFNLENIGQSPARFDFKKLDNLNAHYIRESDDDALVREIEAHLERAAEPRTLSTKARERLIAALPDLKERAKTIVELAQGAEFLFTDGPRELDAQADKIAHAGRARRSGRACPLARKRPIGGPSTRRRRARFRRGQRPQARPGGAAHACGADRPRHVAAHFQHAGSSRPRRIPCPNKGLRD